ncbi:MAG: D-glycero-beta-D-manno-heptose 1,7-bisphosphate 7-phosphatase [Gammaproteobacteria bacterium]|nr:MAG: D-glycero-beta-D-manno-heptose 1,7-bisphosphate 7-phosphatase [Gammaproteobacteria bacterium]
MTRLIILDRDGVINHDSDEYIKSPDEWRPLPGSLQAIANLHRAGYKLVVATNQSGLGRGLFNLDTLRDIHEKMLRQIRDEGGALDGIFYCPHIPNDHCRCRKPETGLFEDIAQRFQASLAEVYAVGDNLRDTQAALAVGAKPIHVLTGKGASVIEARSLPANVPVFDDLACFARYLIAA